jgi:maltooligosyltrehalose trehalohydrolase
VVYNHFGSDGNYIGQYSRDYFTDKYTTDWGEAIGYEGTDRRPVREFFKANARYWIEEFHLDGLRLDATQNVYDQSPEHILAEITKEVRKAADGRQTIVIAENEPQLIKLVRPTHAGGYGMDGLWNDDFHHSAMVALTGRTEAYYTDYKGTPQEFVSSMKYGYLYQGQWYKWQNQCRGTSALGIKPSVSITFIQNHDQVANSARGARLHEITAPGLFRAMTALFLLGPGTPMLFQGQEFASSAPFIFFADVAGQLRDVVAKGRAEFLSQFRSIATGEMQNLLDKPSSPESFLRCKLDFSERQKNKWCYLLHKELLRIRREDPVIRLQGANGLDGAVLCSNAFLLRFFDEEHGDRLLVVNLGRDLHLNPAPEPLLAPLENHEWAVRFSTESPQYGGCGTPPIDTEENWRIPGHSAVLLIPQSPKTRRCSEEPGQ